MRLHHLEMTAFQPFAGTERVDFDALGQAGLFLMQGETGAGKTAILDAICFALFGHVPGLRDTAARLRSDHSGARDRTEVTLELTLAGRRLRITRSPKQERRKVRGGGFTEEPARALLQTADEAGEWNVLADRLDAVEHELRPLLGLTLSQFCQVVLLPQGAFARFLHASSDEREKILQQLFATERYASAELWLTDQRRAAESALYGGLDAVGDIASRIAQVAEEEPPAGWRSEPAQLAAWVQGRTVLADAHEATAQGRRDDLLAVHQRAAQAAAEARALGLAQARHAVAVRELERHREAQERRDAAAELMGAARRAEPAAVLAAGAVRASLRGERTTRLATAALELACGRLVAGEDPQFDREQARERATELREQTAVARGFLALERAASHHRGQIEELRTRMTADEHRLQQRRAQLQQAASERERLGQEAELARDARAALSGLEDVAEQARRRFEAAARRDRLVAQIAVAQTNAATALGAENHARQEWLDARERRLEGIAVELAGELHDGEPCRVCGSPTHPAPQRGHDGKRVDAASEEVLAERARRCSELREQARTALTELERERAGSVAVAGETDSECLVQEFRRATAAADRARTMAAGAEGAERALGEHERQVSEAALLAGEDGERLAAAGAELQARELALAQDGESLRRARAGARTVQDRVEALERHAEEWSRAADSLSEAATATREARERAAEAEGRARDCGFGTAAEACAAALAEEEVQRLARAIEAFDAGLERLRVLAEDPELCSAAEQPAPDDRGAAHALQVAEIELEDARTKHTLACRQARELRELAGGLDERLGALTPLIERRDLVAGVAGLVDGSSVANRLRMPLAAYVLTARLEQIAQAASLRLERMSGGRYLLEHCDERVGRNRKAGLGLQVLDAWTGQERPPSSLSGGETFQASLALALGLADVVAAESGAARLETLFVDEGFGSLGERALDDVLDVLDGLREGGRSVGIISHVAELRQRIPVALQVDKRRGGSRILQAENA